MPVVHVSVPPAPGTRAPERVLPGRVDLSLGQLLLMAHRAGDLHLPLDLPGAGAGADGGAGPEPAGFLRDRLSGSGPTAPEASARTALARETVRAAGEDPSSIQQLRELCVVDDAGTPVGEVVAALGVLAAPEVLLVLDLTVRDPDDGLERRLRSWIAVTGSLVAQLSTSSGTALELAWSDISALSQVLARAATVDTGAETAADTKADPAADEATEPVPERFSIPFDLYTQGTEAARLNRPDVLEEMVRESDGPVTIDGRTVVGAEVSNLLSSVSARATGRLRVLVSVADADSAPRRRVGVVAWSRFDDAWWALDPVTRAHVPRVEARRAEPADLGRVLGPILAEVLG